MDKNSKVADHVGAMNAVVAEGVRKVDISDCAANAILGEIGGERNELGLFRIGFKTVSG